MILQYDEEDSNIDLDYGDAFDEYDEEKKICFGLYISCWSIWIWML